ncbi:MAG: tRNA pseudouridine(54/55) synthase Pus10 [Candidatus Aenigmarchaeota archaeon]|nr:tRNA pseudouridine(54/55) synthase Pus10 [Candidatus Aenigmarchaeota archaeon]
MKISAHAEKILKIGYVCDRCLGRQFASLLTGLTNSERGRSVRLFMAMEYENKPFKTDINNFYGAGLRKKTKARQAACCICYDIFNSFPNYLEKAQSKLRGVEFKTFLVGSRLSAELETSEKQLWQAVGKKHVESLKNEVNREFGKLFEKETGKKFDKDKPDTTILLDMHTEKVSIQIASVFIYGKYKKLVRGIPQTKWEKYPETVEDIVAGPVMRSLDGKEHAFHGMGREDIDVRCLDWRPFVFEVKDPRRRQLDLNDAKKEINSSGKVRVSGLRFSDKNEVRKIKEAKPDKSYRILIEFEKNITQKNLDKLRALRGKQIRQQTPKRVLHRRSDLERKRKVKAITWKLINGHTAELTIKGEAGLYVKELVHGDEGRTMPNISELLKNRVTVKEVDVVRVWI